MAQALVRIEYVDVPYQAALEPAVELFNDYFYGGMAGIVFQEIREARALAYSVGALYFNGRDKADYNYMVGGMGTQADKTPEAVAAFVGLLDDIPSSPERFAAAQLSVLNKYRTERLGFRSVLGAVRGWERKGLTGDPRSWRFEQLQASDLDKVLEFYRQHVQGRPQADFDYRRQEQNGPRGASSAGRGRRTGPRRALCLLMPVDKTRSAV